MILTKPDSLSTRLPTTSATPSKSSTTANSRDRRSDAFKMSGHPSHPTPTTVLILTTTRSRRSARASATGRVRPPVAAATGLLMTTTTVVVLLAATALAATTTAVVRLLATTTTRAIVTPALLLAFADPRSTMPTRRRAPATLMTLTMRVAPRLLAAATSPTLI